MVRADLGSIPTFTHHLTPDGHFNHRMTGSVNRFLSPRMKKYHRYFRQLSFIRENAGQERAGNLNFRAKLDKSMIFNEKISDAEKWEILMSFVVIGGATEAGHADDLCKITKYQLVIK
ncbi:MAG: hypothetical protein H6684_05880 [Deltaproteobacteria bacterium]|nr:hypothetical protein [Deltaproteobacteria bacterium]MCB9478725.1 hypothetical protein [Deltaproteobacteria bacterium]MCB9488241.1 hypothetical protein [Deltaproteobacteria bacterium]